ncbi:MAG: hypothetical protein PHE09_09280 [Oscillospiraceae bacterium]|nr:hypothetical protein [Oscillospiraceae bacterium]
MEYGRILTTRGVSNEMEESPVFAGEVAAAFNRYQRKDWGELSQEDKDLNNQAIGAGERILAAYQTSKGKIWIITEWDRSATTILFPSEY